ncbi:HD domain-containing protein [Pontiellaceae bacterium B1224]|nr:HD domain-containing protein [Pontiellaceae bacterium B1224]
MNSAQLQTIKFWFTNYTKSFAIERKLNPVLQLKVDHCQRVADNSRQLAEDMGWNATEANRAEALGWLHDVGRFSQFTEFGTFMDSAAINHGERGWEIVRESGILPTLAPEERAVLLDGIRYHNAKNEPDHLAEVSRPFLKLIRDADKLDIYRIVLDSIEADGFQELPNMLPQIVLQGPVSPDVLCQILKHRSCSTEAVRSLADFLMMQLCWIYDLNYPVSFQLVSERNIIGRFEQLLPENQAVGQFVQDAREYMNKNALKTCGKDIAGPAA